MRKFTIFATILLACFALCACAPTKSALYGGSYFLQNAQTIGVGEINETLTYSVKYQSTENAKLIISLDNTSTYTTNLSNTTYNGQNCYLLHTELLINGSIDNEGTTTPLADSIVTNTYFLGVSDNLRPLYSERAVKCCTIKQVGAKYNVYSYDYKLATTYNDYNATTAVTINAKPETDTRFTESIGKTFKNVANGASFVDNELLLFAPRAINLNSSTYSAFYTLDAISQTNHKMTFKASAEPTKTLSPVSYYNNGMKVTSVLCNGVQISIDSSAKGSDIIAYYAQKTEQANERGVMVMATTSAPYNLGTYTYEITSSIR